MTNEDFNLFIEVEITRLKTLLFLKGNEYGKADRLHNFKEAGKILSCTPERALLGFLTKHIVSVVDMVQDLEDGVHNTHEVWQEKLGDVILYSFLLLALKVERLSHVEPRHKTDGDV